MGVSCFLFLIPPGPHIHIVTLQERSLSWATPPSGRQQACLGKHTNCGRPSLGSPGETLKGFVVHTPFGRDYSSIGYMTQFWGSCGCQGRPQSLSRAVHGGGNVPNSQGPTVPRANHVRKPSIASLDGWTKYLRLGYVVRWR